MTDRQIEILYNGLIEEKSVNALDFSIALTSVTKYLKEKIKEKVTTKMIKDYVKKEYKRIFG